MTFLEHTICENFDLIEGKGTLNFSLKPFYNDHFCTNWTIFEHTELAKNFQNWAPMISCTKVIKTSNWWRSFIFVSQLYRRRHYFINLVRKINFFKSRQIWRWATYHIFLIFAEIDIDEHSQTTSVDVIFEFFLRLYF